MSIMFSRFSIRFAGAAILMFCCGMTMCGSASATPEKASAFYEDALKRFEKDDYAGSVVQLKNAIQQDQRMLAAHLLLGKALLKSGDLKAGEAAFEEAIKQGIDRGEVALPLAQLYMALGEAKLVIERVNTANLPPVLRAQVLAIRGAAYAELGNTRMASQSFEEARTADPRSPDPLIAEVPVLLSAGQRDRAAAVAAKAVEVAPTNGYAWNMQASVKHLALDVKGALADYNRAIDLEPRLSDARIARAALLIDLNRDADAVKDLDFLSAIAVREPRAAYLRALVASRKGEKDAMVKSFKEAVGVLDALPARWLATREQYLMVGGLAHHALGNQEKAKEYLESISQRNPQNTAARKLLASIYVDRRDLTRAQPLLESLQKLLPDDPQVLFLTGTMMLSQRRYAQATDFLERAVARTGRPDMTRNLAFSQIGLGREQLGLASLEKTLATNPDDTLAGTTLAMLLARSGQPQKAIKTAESLLKRNPDNLTALNFVGSTRGGTGDIAGARASFAKVLAKDPNFLPAILNLVKLDVVERKFDDGRQRLAGILAKQNANPDALFELGLLEQTAGNLAEAIRHFKKANEAQRRDTRAGLALIDVQLAQKQADEALATAKDMAARFPESINIQMALARTYIAAGDPGTAKNLLQNATRMAEYDPEMQVSIGRMQLSARNADGAAYNVQKALQGRPDDLAALALAVEVEAQRNDNAKADAALKALAAKYPNRAETALMTAMLAMIRRQYPAAVAAYRTALSLNESTGNVLNLAGAHLAAGETAKTVGVLETWLKKKPGDTVVLKALAQAQFRAGTLPQARLTYTKAMLAEPDNPALLNDFANLLHKLGDAAALTSAERAVKLAPNEPAYADTLGWLMVQKGQMEGGLRYLREARLRSPENAEIRYHLAYALSKTGRMSEAREELKVALGGGAQFPGIDDAQKLRRELGL
jgi:cellulose synthase operon protein C